MDQAPEVRALRRSIRRLLPLGLLILSSACSSLPTVADKPERSHVDYVAMGSSFAAGPGIEPVADPGSDRCGRSRENYAQLLARSKGLTLEDVSCSGATTTALLEAWGDRPAQVSAVTRQTRLVTITIGGNDVGYIGGMMATACRAFPTPPSGTPNGRCPDIQAPMEADFIDLEASLAKVVDAIRHRAPRAEIVFTGYLAVLPPGQLCEDIPLTSAQATQARAVAKRLDEAIKHAAASARVRVLDAATLSIGHDACSSDPWVTGFPQVERPLPSNRFHPNRTGMTAVATALDVLLGGELPTAR